MLSCWNADPKARPTFSNLERELQGILDWDASEETDTLYVNIEPLTPPAMLNTWRCIRWRIQGFLWEVLTLQRGHKLYTLPKVIKKRRKNQGILEKFGPSFCPSLVKARVRNTQPLSLQFVKMYYHRNTLCFIELALQVKKALIVWNLIAKTTESEQWINHAFIIFLWQR